MSCTSLSILVVAGSALLLIMCCIIFFFQLTAISVIVLVKAIEVAMSDNRDFKGISSDHFIRIQGYCINPFLLHQI